MEPSDKGQEAAAKILALVKQLIEVEHHHSGAIAGCLIGTGIGLMCDLGVLDSDITDVVAKVLVGVRRSVPAPMRD